MLNRIDFAARRDESEVKINLLQRWIDGTDVQCKRFVVDGGKVFRLCFCLQLRQRCTELIRRQHVQLHVAVARVFVVFRQAQLLGPQHLDLEPVRLEPAAHGELPIFRLLQLVLLPDALQIVAMDELTRGAAERFQPFADRGAGDRFADRAEVVLTELGVTVAQSLER